MPRIDDILDPLGRAKYFSCLDLMSGFHKIGEKQTNGSYIFTRQPNSFKVAPTSFQRMMTLAFAGLKPDQAFLYMDDFVVLECSEKHMLPNLSDDFNLCCKVFILYERSNLSGCTDKGILPDDSKYENYLMYTDANSEKCFAALCNY